MYNIYENWLYVINSLINKIVWYGVGYTVNISSTAKLVGLTISMKQRLSYNNFQVSCVIWNLLLLRDRQVTYIDKLCLRN